jgi:hypothetical protein
MRTSRSSAAALALMLLPSAAAAAAPALDPLKTGFNPAPAVDAVSQAIKNAGGNPDGQAVHLILGFATGNMPNDPVGAGAMRQVAQQLLNRFLVAGDTVTAVGFEKDVWTGLEPWNQPFDPKQKETFWRQWPQTTAPDTVGGSDYSRALVRILDKVSRTNAPANFVVVLLGDYDLAQGPYAGAGRSPLSERSRLFRTSLKRASSTPLAHAASFPFVQTRSSSVQRSIWMYVATPEHFAMQELAGGKRSALIPVDSWYPVDDPYAPPAVRDNGEQHNRDGDLPPVWPFLAILVPVAAVAIWRLRRCRPLTLTLTPEGNTPSQREGPFGKLPVWRLVGAGFPESQILPNDITVGTRGQAPPRVLMEVRGAGQAVRLVPMATSLSVNGIQTSSGTTLRPGLRKVTLSGQYQPAVGGPNVPFSIQLEFKLA